MAESGPPPNINVAAQLGPIIVGLLVMVFCLGLLASELSLWVKRFPRERLWIKILVWCLTLLAATATVTAAMGLWYMSIDYRDRPAVALLVYPIVSAPELAAGTFVTPLASFFFAYRTWTLYKRNVWAGVVLGLGFTAVTVTCVVSVSLGEVAFYGNLPPAKFPAMAASAQRWAEAHFTVTAIFDCAVSAALTFRLARDVKGNFKKTDGILRRLIRLSLTTATITSLLQLGNMATLFTSAAIIQANPDPSKRTNAGIAFSYPMSTIAPLCVVVALNARHSAGDIGMSGSTGGVGSQGNSTHGRARSGTGGTSGMRSTHGGRYTSQRERDLESSGSAGGIQVTVSKLQQVEMSEGEMELSEKGEESRYSGPERYHSPEKYNAWERHAPVYGERQGPGYGERQAHPHPFGGRRVG